MTHAERFVYKILVKLTTDLRYCVQFKCDLPLESFETHGTNGIGSNRKMELGMSSLGNTLSRR